MSFKIAMEIAARPLATLGGRPGRSVLALGALCLLLARGMPAFALASAPAEASVRSVLTMLAAAGEDYREAVHDGQVVRPIEYAEATAFLEDAAGRLDGLPVDAPARTALRALLADTTAALQGKAAPDAVTAQLAVLRQRLAAATGVSEVVYPPEAPSTARGQQLFQTNCVGCHGAHGDGKGPDAAQLRPPPANFTDAQFMRDETPYDFYHVISLGKRNTAMPAWESGLSVQERWDLVSYLWTLSPGAGGLREGQGVYLAHCASCHGATGTGRGAFAAVLLTPAPDLTQPQALARQADADLFRMITDGKPGTPMPAFARSLSAEERWKAVAFVRWLSLGGPPASAASAVEPGGGGAPPADSGAAALAESARLLDAAVAAYGRGEAAAVSIASEAYLAFEPLEQRLGGRAPALRTRIEEQFLQLRQELRTPGRALQVQALAAGVHAEYTAAREALRPSGSPYALFVESATIILREGLEMVLVIGALIAYVGKVGQTSMRRALYAGTAAGVLASLGTAVLLGEILLQHPGSADLLEGLTMLLAAVVLFWVSYWLISKAEADRWQRYIRDKVSRAVSGGHNVALAGAAFLAVYREGFETVLFYQALYASAPGASVTLTAGLAAGAVLLALVFVALRRFQLRLPLGQFFFATGVFLYAMAAVFAGQGVHELQDAGWLPMTALGLVPTVPLLGIYPSIESLAAQAAFVLLFLYATAVILRRRRRTSRADGRAATDARHELQALRAAVDALRTELAEFRSGAPPAAGAALGESLRAVVQRLDALTAAGSAPEPSRRN